MIYLSGPMSGLPDSNFPAFHAEAARLRALGHHVLNPAENVIPGNDQWLDYMRLAISQLIKCDCVHLLPGWERSRGACIERRLAVDLGMRVEYPD